MKNRSKTCIDKLVEKLVILKNLFVCETS